jgi:16S rRNA (adenine1518-N6/adenine1519-N6)-dimethyltransferase
MSSGVLDPRSPKAQLVEHQLTPKHHFGQNFLADHTIAARIAELCAPPGARVLELGAGLGALTRPLLARGAHVVAVERDRDLVPVLRAELAEAIDAGQLEVLEADAKAVDPTALLAVGTGPRVLCGNLPYQITGPLLELTIQHVRSLSRAVFLVQLEVATRLAAAPGSKDYGALSVFTQAAFNVTRALIVRRGAFYPQPNVDSAVVLLQPRAALIEETTLFRDLVHGAFAQRRKTLHNAWRGVNGRERGAIERAAERAQIDLTLRGETLSVEDFARMAQAIGASE